MPTEPAHPNLDVAPEIAEALKSGLPVVALESTIISHGMPYPRNVETALSVEEAVRGAGAVPATIAILNGRLRQGRRTQTCDLRFGDAAGPGRG